MLAYLFWHRPRDGVPVEEYEAGLLAFHRSLARRPPVGLLGSAALRLHEIPWLPAGGEERGGYEDWYLVEDFAALGVLNEAAVGRGHRSAHDHVAGWTAAGAGGLYALLEGDIRPPGLGGVADAPMAVWVQRPAGSGGRALEQLLGDGIDPDRASLWCRQLVFGPAPELCVLAGEPPPGVARTRLPDGWVATDVAREALDG